MFCLLYTVVASTHIVLVKCISDVSFSIVTARLIVEGLIIISLCGFLIPGIAMVT